MSINYKKLLLALLEDDEEKSIPVTTKHESLPVPIKHATNVSVESGDPFEIGKKYFIRTVTYHYVGTLIGKFEKNGINELVFNNCSWVAESGRYAKSLSSGEFSEVEPYPEHIKVVINRCSIIDASEWSHDLFEKAIPE